MTIKELNGSIVKFGGVYETTYLHKDYDDDPGSDANVTFVLLNDSVFAFKENPRDGYRSHCEIYESAERPDNARFSCEHTPVYLYCMTGQIQMDPDGYGGQFDGVLLYKINNKEFEPCCKFGTSNSDDYYPSFTNYVDVVLLNS